MPKRKAEEEAEEPQVEDQEDVSDASGSDSESSSGDSDSEPDVSDDEDESEDDEEGDAFAQVDVNFEFYDPMEKDFHGLKALLNTYLDGQQYDCSGLVEAIIAQATVGIVVKAGEDDDPVAVMTVLNTQRYKEHPAMQQIRAFALSKCSDQKAKQQIAQAWDAAGTGLVINERLINSPPQLAPPLMQGLFDEIAWATEDEPTAELKESFKFKQYILLTRVYKDPAADTGAAGAGPSSSGKPPKGPTKQKASDVIVYVRPEDEYLHQHCSCSSVFPVEGRTVAKDELQPMRLLMLLQADKVPVARATLDTVIGNMAAKP